MKYEAVAQSLRARGYALGIPVKRLRELVDGNGLEPGIAAADHCDTCGTVGLRYQFWVGTGESQMLTAVTICPACGEAEEF
jgi:hypothetical protein